MTSRPLWLRAPFVVCLLALVVVATSRHLLHHAAVAQAMRIHAPGLSPEIAKKMRLIVVGHDHVYDADWIHGTSYWRFGSPSWVVAVFIILPESDATKLVGLDLAIGTGESVSFSNADIAQWTKEPATNFAFLEQIRKPGDVVLWVPDAFQRVSALPGIAYSLTVGGAETKTPVPWNWPGDSFFARALAEYSLLPMLLVLLFVFFARKVASPDGRAWCSRVLTASPTTPPPIPVAARAPWNWISVVFLAAILTLLEAHSPFYFTQDDNLIECLPTSLVGLRGIWMGEFPDYNPYVYMGAPLASLGLYALTYPPLHLSYAVARHLLGQEFATYEVFAIAHILAGFFVIRCLSCKFGMGPLPANLTALSCVLSGAVLIMGRCWFSFLPTIVWTPVLLLGLVRLGHGPVGWKWALGIGLASGLTFHVGFTQVAMYINGFFCLAVAYLVASGGIPWRRALAVFPALIIGAGIAMPLLFQQLIFAGNITRQVVVDSGVAVGLPAFLLPYPFVEVTLPYPMGSENLQFMGEFYFFGGLLAFLFFFQVVGLAFVLPRQCYWPGQLWTFLAIIALWLALGDVGGLWWLLKRLPVVGFINRHPMRLMPFVVLFISLAGGLVLQRMLEGSKHRRRAEIIVAIPALTLLLMHAIHCRTAFYTYRFTPYPPPPAQFEHAFFKDGKAQGRVSSWSVNRSSDPNFAWLLPLDLPAVYRLPSVDGYNPILGGMTGAELKGKTQVLAMIEKLRADPHIALKEYGIRWHLFHAPDRMPPLSPVSTSSWTMELFGKSVHFDPPPTTATFRRVAEVEEVVLTELPDVRPLAFTLEKPGQGLDATMSTRGIDVDLQGIDKDQVVIVNFLYYADYIRAYADGQAVPCQADRWLRIQLAVPAGSETLSIRYEPPWMKGIGIGAVLVVVGLGGVFFMRKS